MIYSQVEDFGKHTMEMRSWFYKRGYPKGLIKKKWVKLNSLDIPEETKKETHFCCDVVSPKS